MCISNSITGAVIIGADITGAGMIGCCITGTGCGTGMWRSITTSRGTARGTGTGTCTSAPRKSLCKVGTRSGSGASVAGGWTRQGGLGWKENCEQLGSSLQDRYHEIPACEKIGAGTGPSSRNAHFHLFPPPKTEQLRRKTIANKE